MDKLKINDVDSLTIQKEIYRLTANIYYLLHNNILDDDKNLISLRKSLYYLIHGEYNKIDNKIDFTIKEPPKDFSITRPEQEVFKESKTI